MKGDTITCNAGQIVEDRGDTIRVFIPMELRKRSGRKEIVLPDVLPDDDSQPTPLAIAFARAYVWQTWLDERKYTDAEELAKYLGIDVSLVRRVLRLNVVSPRIVEDVLNGKDIFVSIRALMEMEVSVVWEEQDEGLCGTGIQERKAMQNEPEP
jgi:site-specific DNA recombinase